MRLINKIINKIRNREAVSNKLCEEKTYQTSVEALKMIYYVIIGLAITEALRITFVGQEGKFLGGEILKDKITLFLLGAFLVTIVRFVHGASIYLEMDKNVKTRWKPLWDFTGFVLHGSLFYMMAVSLKKVSAFSISFALMLIVDAVWILIPCWWYTKKLDFTSRQWLISDFCIIILLYRVYVADRSMTCVWSAVAILIIAIVAAIFDYSLNKRFYFPKQLSQK